MKTAGLGRRAVMRRHSDKAARPRRKNRSIRRLGFVRAKTIVPGVCVRRSRFAGCPSSLITHTGLPTLGA